MLTVSCSTISHIIKSSFAENGSLIALVFIIIRKGCPLAPLYLLAVDALGHLPEAANLQGASKVFGFQGTEMSLTIILQMTMLSVHFDPTSIGAAFWLVLALCIQLQV